MDKAMDKTIDRAMDKMDKPRVHYVHWVHQVHYVHLSTFPLELLRPKSYHGAQNKGKFR